MNSDENKQLVEMVYKIKNTVDRLETNWEMDRKDFAEFQNRLGHLEVEFKQLRDQILLLPKRTGERVDTMIGKIEHEAQDLRNAISNSGVKVIEKIKKKHWYKLWL